MIKRKTKLSYLESRVEIVANIHQYLLVRKQRQAKHVRSIATTIITSSKSESLSSAPVTND